MRDKIHKIIMEYMSDGEEMTPTDKMLLAINKRICALIDADCISRQDAIDAIVAWTVEDRPDIEMPTDLVDRVNALPSAEPQIIRCKYCKHRSKSGLCHMWSVYGTVRTDDDMYCSYGERGDLDV